MDGAKYRILWIIDGLGPGGAERMTPSIMEKFDRERFDLRVCVLQEKHGNPFAKELEKIGIPIDLLNIPVLRHPANLPKLLKYIQKHNPQIIHTQSEFADILGSIAGALLRIPCVSTQHTLPNPTKGTAYWRNRIKWLSLRYFCTKIISISDNARLFYINNEKIPRQKIINIYNGIDLSFFQRPTPHTLKERRRSLNLPIDGIVFTTVAVLRELKGIQYMIKAIPLILETIPNFYYLIVGDGEYGETLKKMALSYGLGKHVIFTGKIQDLDEIFAVSDVIVLPSLAEVLPTVLIEAMAAQKSIIATNVGGIPEMITHGLNGLLVEPANTLELARTSIQLAQNKNQREAMAIAGHIIAHKKFNIINLIENLNNLYKELIANGR